MRFLHKLTRGEPDAMANANRFIRDCDDETEQIMERINARRSELRQLDQAEYEIRMLVARIKALNEIVGEVKEGEI